MPSLTSLPKVELHIHVEGSVRPERFRELAERDGVPLPPALGDDDGWDFASPMDFIENYIAACSVLTRLEDFRRIAIEFCEDLAATGVRYAEAVFSPGNHARRFDDDWFGPIEAVLDGLAAGERAHGVVVRLCPDIVRDMGLDDAERTLEVALRYAGKGVIALNAAGSERTGRTRAGDADADAAALSRSGLRRFRQLDDGANSRVVVMTRRRDAMLPDSRAVLIEYERGDLRAAEIDAEVWRHGCGLWALGFGLSGLG